MSVSSDMQRGGSKNGATSSASAPSQTGEEVTALSEGAKRAYEAASEETRRFGQFVRDQATDIVQRQKSGLAHAVADIARQVRSASQGLSDQPNIDAIINQAADRVDAAAAALEQKSTDELYDDAEDFCRRYPVAVAACAVVLGALVSRALKAPARPHR